MKVIINDMKAFKLILICCAKNDVRYYLNGFFIDIEKNRLASTDGHRLAYSECIASVSDIDKNTTIAITDRKIPKKAKSLVVSDDIITYYSEPEGMGDRLGIVPISTVDCKYPDYGKTIKDFDEKPDMPLADVALNFKYLKDMDSVIDSRCALKMAFKGEGEPIRITVKTDSESDFLIMPVVYR